MAGVGGSPNVKVRHRDSVVTIEISIHGSDLLCKFFPPLFKIRKSYKIITIGITLGFFRTPGDRCIGGLPGRSGRTTGGRSPGGCGRPGGSGKRWTDLSTTLVDTGRAASAGYTAAKIRPGTEVNGVFII